MALKHSLKVTPDPIERATATGGATGGDNRENHPEKVGPLVGTSLAETTVLSGHEGKQILEIPEENEKSLPLKGRRAPRAGFEPATY